MVVRLLRFFRPGSTAWLVGWQLLLQWRGLSRQPWVRWWVFMPLFLVFQYCALVVVQHWARFPKVVVWTALAAVIIVVAGACFSRTIQAILRFLSQPSMLRLFFLAPISERELGRMSVLNIVLYSTLYIGFFYAPLALALLLYGHAAGFAFFVWLPAFAMLSTLLGLSCVLFLLSLLGPRRARKVFQFLGSGASMILISLVVVPLLGPRIWQPLWDTIQNSFTSEAWWSRTGWIQWMTQLALGNVPALAGLDLLAVVLFRWTEPYWGARLFTLQHTMLEDMKSSRRVPLQRFQLNGIGVFFRKEWRMLWRDPRMSSEVLIDAAQVLPLILVGMYNTRNFQLVPLLCLGWVALGSLIASRLCWLSMSVESGAAWYAMAPNARMVLRDTKWLSVAIPFVGVTFLAAVGVWWLSNWYVTRTFLLIAIASILISSRMQLWMTAPLSSMHAFYQRLPRSPLAEVLGIFFIYGTTFLYLLTLAWGFEWTRWGLIPLACLVATAYVFRLPVNPASHVR